MKDKGRLFLNPVRNYFMRERNTFRCFDSQVIISVSSIYEPLCDEFWITSVTSEHSSVSTPFWRLHSQHNHSLQVWQDLWSGVSIKKKFGSAPSPTQMFSVTSLRGNVEVLTGGAAAAHHSWHESTPPARWSLWYSPRVCLHHTATWNTAKKSCGHLAWAMAVREVSC